MLLKLSRFISTSTRHCPKSWSKLSPPPFSSQSQNFLKNVFKNNHQQQLRSFSTICTITTTPRSISRSCNFKGLLSYNNNVNVPFSCTSRSFLSSSAPGPGGDGKALDDDLIYVGEHDRSLRYLKLFSLNSSFIGLMCQGILLQKGIEATAAQGFLIFGASIGFLSMFTFVTPVLIHLLCKRYITELRYDPQIDTYRATCYNFFLKRFDFDFRAEDIFIPEVPGMFTTFLIKMKNGKKRPVFLAPNNFIVLEHYGRFMGYDKPLDFHLEPKEIDEALKEMEESKRIKAEEIEKSKSKTKAKKRSSSI